MSKEDGGPAFPCQQVRNLITDGAGGPPLRQVAMWTGGMSLRDWFEGQALRAWIMALAYRHDQPGYHDDDVVGYAAQYALKSADAMLAERENKE